MRSQQAGSLRNGGRRYKLEHKALGFIWVLVLLPSIEVTLGKFTKSLFVSVSLLIKLSIKNGNNNIAHHIGSS